MDGLDKPSQSSGTRFRYLAPSIWIAVPISYQEELASYRSLLHSLVADIITKRSQSVPEPGLMAVLTGVTGMGWLAPSPRMEPFHNLLSGFMTLLFPRHPPGHPIRYLGLQARGLMQDGRLHDGHDPGARTGI